MLRSGEIWTSMLFFRKGMDYYGNLSYLHPFTRNLWADDSFVASYSISRTSTTQPRICFFRMLRMDSSHIATI